MTSCYKRARNFFFFCFFLQQTTFIIIIFFFFLNERMTVRYFCKRTQLSQPRSQLLFPTFCPLSNKFCDTMTISVSPSHSVRRYPPTSTKMALLLPITARSLQSCSRPDARPTLRRRASLSGAPTTAPVMAVAATGEVDWIKATAGFFENDTRPIMLFDGISAITLSI